MKLLVLSDSHSTLSFMRRCIESVKPDVMIHLGDHFDDGAAMQEEYPQIRLYQVPGNCDRHRCPANQPEILIPRIGGVDLYITHGHRHSVKSYQGALLQDARASGAAAALYGHTHVPHCHREEDGLWVLNPGSCGYFGGSAGLLEIEDGRITSCRLLNETDIMPV